MCPRSVPKKSPRKPTVAKLWMLLIGVNKYDDEEIPNLEYSALDCQGLEQALIEATDSLPGREIISHYDFSNPQPILNLIWDSIGKIICEAKSNDTILFYFSGHGIFDGSNQQVYLCVKDTKYSNLVNTALPLKELLNKLGNCQATQQIVWLDACHSGGMTLRGRTKISLPNPTEQLVKDLRKKAQQSQGFYSLLSCDASQESWEFPELGHGVFTYYLIQGLRGEAADVLGIIKADALYQYVYHQTLRYIDKINQQIRLINQQKSSRGINYFQSEYPLQTPKRIVEGFGEVVIGKREGTVLKSLLRKALIVDGLSSDRTLELSKILKGKGKFHLEYFPPNGKEWKDLLEEIISCFNSSLYLNEETTTSILYLRGKIQYGKRGEAWLVFKDGTYISREWLRRVLHDSSITQQIIILDCLNDPRVTEWIEELKLDGDKGQCILASALSQRNNNSSTPTKNNIEAFNNALLSTLKKYNPQTGLSIAYWISQLQLELASGNINLHVWLSSTPGVIEVLPIKNKHRKSGGDSSVYDFNICPYMGLKSFTEDKAQYFYGRDTLIQKLLDRLIQKNTIAVVGASGSGKSSIIQAGLFPLLRQGDRIPSSDRWMLKCFSPNCNPFQSLANTLAHCDTNDRQTKIAESAEDIESLLREGVNSFVPWLRTRPEPIVVLAVDRFEELFTKISDLDREQFIKLLLDTIEYCSDRFYLILNIRADFVSCCLEIPQLAPIVQNNSVLIPPYLRGIDYRNAIIKPATQVGLKVESGLVEVLLQDLDGATGDLPLLQFILEKLWQNRKVGVLTLDAYKKLGGIKGALEKHAQEVYNRLDEKSKECSRWIFINLTTINSEGKFIPRRITKSELITSKYPQSLVEKTLQKLTTSKLIVVNLDNSFTTEITSLPTKPLDNTKLFQKAIKQEATVEIIRPILISHWSSLRQWLNEAKSCLRLQRQIEDYAILWKNNNKQSDYLITGDRLKKAGEVCREYNNELTELAQNFIRVSLDRQSYINKKEKEKQTQFKIITFALSFFILSTIFLGIVAYRQKLDLDNLRNYPESQ